MKSHPSDPSGSEPYSPALAQRANRGRADAQCSIGLCYENGTGIEKNDEEAVRWYRKAAEQGFAPAQSKLGFSYMRGTGVEKNEEEAVRWFRKAAKQGDRTAQFNLDQRQTI